jgi:LacI family gluconate utilization system Gnt-I transcriptional repressor
MPDQPAPKAAPGKRPRASGRVTLQDVARSAGVSPITVSRALRGERAVAADLVERVRQAVQQLGYVPDPAARALASSRSSHVAVLIPLLSNALFVDLLDAVQRALLPAGFQTLIGVTHYDPAEEEALLRSYLLHRPAGLIVTGFDRTPAARQLIEASAVPCVHVMETVAADGVYSVGFSQAEAGYAMTRALLADSHRHVAFAAAQLDPRTLQRAEGYRRALREAGRPPREWLDPQRSSLALGGRLFEQILLEAPEIDAIFFNNDDLAQGALLAALRLGVRVPAEIAVAGFNDLTGSDQMLPALTTVRTPRSAIGHEAATMLMTLMRGETVAQPRLDLGFEIVRRGSG